MAAGTILTISKLVLRIKLRDRIEKGDEELTDVVATDRKPEHADFYYDDNLDALEIDHPDDW